MMCFHGYGWCTALFLWCSWLIVRPVCLPSWLDQEEKAKAYKKEKQKEKKRKAEEDLNFEEDDEMAAVMGFSGFGGSKKSHWTLFPRHPIDLSYSTAVNWGPADFSFLTLFLNFFFFFFFLRSGSICKIFSTDTLLIFLHAWSCPCSPTAIGIRRCSQLFDDPFNQVQQS